MERIRVGSVEVVALVDNDQSWPAAAVYPAAGEAALTRLAHNFFDGNVRMNFGCFLLRDGSSTVLVDTGWGPENGGQLLKELEEAGVTPAEVDSVIFTHLHGDHTGWNVDRATGAPIFSKARYLVPKGDWDHYGASDPRPESFKRDVVPLNLAGNVDLFDGELTLSSSLTAVPTPGHTPGHTSIVIASGGEHGYILGDVVLSGADAEDVDLPNTYDWDNAIAASTRRRVVEQLISNGALVGASHLPPPGLGRFVRVDGRSAWRAGTAKG